VIKTGKAFGILFALLTALAAHASVSVQSMVDRNEMGLGDTLILTVAVNSTESVDVSEPRVPELSDFDLVNSWTSSSTSSIRIDFNISPRSQKKLAINRSYRVTFPVLFSKFLLTRVVWWW